MRCKYDLYKGSLFLGTINQTLRVVQTPVDDECYTQALQYMVDQKPTEVLAIPHGCHKKSDCLTLTKIARKGGKHAK